MTSVTRAMLGGADRERGCFRAYLLGAVKHFLGDTRDRIHAAKRGAKHHHVPLVAGTDTSPGIEVTQAAIAAQLGMSEAAVKVAIHRLRKRFHDLVKAEIAETVASEDEAREELRYLIEVVS